MKTSQEVCSFPSFVQCVDFEDPVEDLEARGDGRAQDVKAWAPELQHGSPVAECLHQLLLE